MTKTASPADPTISQEYLESGIIKRLSITPLTQEAIRYKLFQSLFYEHDLIWDVKISENPPVRCFMLDASPRDPNDKRCLHLPFALSDLSDRPLEYFESKINSIVSTLQY
jgi:hypothetical protein